MSKAKRAARLDALTKQFVDVLASAEAQEVAFLYGALDVGPAGWREIAGAVLAAPPVLSVEMNSTYLRQIGARAAYRRDRDTFVFGSFATLETPRERAVALHEAVHALQDRQRVTVPELASEAAGYIAEAWYCLAAGAEPSVEVGPAARRIAAALRGAGGRPAVADADRKAAEAELIAAGYQPGRHFAGDGWARAAP